MLEKIKPSKGVIVYSLFVLLALLINLSGLQEEIHQAIIRVGINDYGTQKVVDDTLAELYNPPREIASSKLVGRLIGSVIGLIVLWGIVTLKEWARRVHIALCFLPFVVYIIRAPALMKYYGNMFEYPLWRGCTDSPNSRWLARGVAGSLAWRWAGRSWARAITSSVRVARGAVRVVQPKPKP